MGEALNIRRGGRGGIEKQTVTSGKTVHIGDPLFLRSDGSVDAEMKTVVSSNIISSSVYISALCKTSVDTKTFSLCTDYKARYITLSSSGATAGSAITITDAFSPTGLIEIDVNKVIAYGSSKACVLTLNPSAGTFTIGTIYAVSQFVIGSAVKLSADTVVFRNGGSGSSFVLCKVSGTSLSFGSVYVADASHSCVGLCALLQGNVFALLNDLSCCVLKSSGMALSVVTKSSVSESGIACPSPGDYACSIGNTVLLTACGYSGGSSELSQRAFRFVKYESNQITIDGGWQRSDDAGYDKYNRPYYLSPRFIQISEHDILAASRMRWDRGGSDYTTVFYCEVFHLESSLSTCGRKSLQAVHRYRADTGGAYDGLIRTNSGKVVWASAGARNYIPVMQFSQPEPYGMALSGAGSGEKCTVAVWDKVLGG